MSDYCVICGALLTHPDTGRPRVYCGQACRRQAEFKIRRLTKRLDVIETELSEIRLMGRHYLQTALFFETPEAAIAAYTAERDLLLAQLQPLLEGDYTTSEEGQAND